MVIRLYVSRTCGNMMMRGQQDHIKRILEAKQIDFEEVDVSDPNRKQEKLFMQETLHLTDDDLIALPPQVFNERAYRGDYDQFFVALERENLFRYLDLDIPPEEVEYHVDVSGLSRDQEPELEEQIPRYTESDI